MLRITDHNFVTFWTLKYEGQCVIIWVNKLKPYKFAGLWWRYWVPDSGWEVSEDFKKIFDLQLYRYNEERSHFRKIKICTCKWWQLLNSHVYSIFNLMAAAYISKTYFYFSFLEFLFSRKSFYLTISGSGPPTGSPSSHPWLSSEVYPI